MKKIISLLLMVFVTLSVLTIATVAEDDKKDKCEALSYTSFWTDPDESDGDSGYFKGDTEADVQQKCENKLAEVAAEETDECFTTCQTVDKCSMLGFYPNVDYCSTYHVPGPVIPATPPTVNIRIVNGVQVQEIVPGTPAKQTYLYWEANVHFISRCECTGSDDPEEGSSSKKTSVLIQDTGINGGIYE